MSDSKTLAMSHFQQAAACYQQARYVEAIQNYLSGIKLDKSHFHIYADLAKAYEMVGRWDQALSYLDIALQLCPDSPTVHRRLSRISEEKTYYQQIIANEALKVDPPPEFINILEDKDLESPQSVVEDKFFKLSVEPALMPKTLWYICQLIVKTYKEVGSKLDCFPDGQISISIINSVNAPLQIDMPSWASGCYNGHILLKYCADGEPELGVLWTLIRHEWTHLLVDMLTDGNCPIWLNEGLAQAIARPLLSFEKLALEQADQNGILPTYNELSQPFNHSASERKIAYLQSAAIVSSLIDDSGFHSIRNLLQLIRNDTPIDIALQLIYNKCVITN